MLPDAKHHVDVLLLQPMTAGQAKSLKYTSPIEDNENDPASGCPAASRADF